MRKMKKFLMIAMAAASLSLTVPVLAAETGATKTETTAGITQTQVKKGLVKEGKKLVYYDKNGKKLKNRWKHAHKNYYYFDQNGYAVTGGKKIGNYVYVFDRQGRAVRPAKTSIQKVGKSLFYVDTKGRAKTGWFTIGNRLYKADWRGRLTTSKTVSNITFNKKGYAKSNMESQLKLKLMSTISSITTPDMSSYQKLYACWRYLTGSGNFYYSGYNPDFSQKGWQRDLAYRMLLTGGGDCYGFACTFAAMANELGFDAYVVIGRVSGTRDGAADGLTRHGWCIINGAYYDPEAQFAGWYKGVYGNGSYDINHTVQRIVNIAE